MTKLKNTAGKPARLQPALRNVARSKDLLLQLSKNCNVYFFRFLLRHMDRSLNGQVGWKAIFLLILRLPFSSVQVQARTRVIPKQNNPVWFRHKVKKVRVNYIVRKCFGCQEKESESDFAINCPLVKKKTMIIEDIALQENVLFVRLSSTQLSFRETSRSLARW